MCATRLYYVFLVCTLGYYIKSSTITIDSHVRCSAINPGVQLYIIITWFTVTYCCRGMGAVRVEFRGVTPDFSGLPSPYVPGRGGATQKKRVSTHSFDPYLSYNGGLYSAVYRNGGGGWAGCIPCGATASPRRYTGGIRSRGELGTRGAPVAAANRRGWALSTVHIRPTGR